MDVCLKFQGVVSSTWNVLLPELYMAQSLTSFTSFSNITSSKNPVLTTLFKIAIFTPGPFDPLILTIFFHHCLSSNNLYNFLFPPFF